MVAVSMAAFDLRLKVLVSAGRTPDRNQVHNGGGARALRAPQRRTGSCARQHRPYETLRLTGSKPWGFCGRSTPPVGICSMVAATEGRLGSRRANGLSDVDLAAFVARTP
jgi:hypothetical protein